MKDPEDEPPTFVDRDGNVISRPPAGSSSSQRMRWANERSTKPKPRPEPFTELELGMSFEELERCLRSVGSTWRILRPSFGNRSVGKTRVQPVQRTDAEVRIN